MLPSLFVISFNSSYNSFSFFLHETHDTRCSSYHEYYDVCWLGNIFAFHCESACDTYSVLSRKTLQRSLEQVFL